MIKRILPIALLGISAIGYTACNNSGFKNKNGLEYKIVKDLPGKKAAVGDIVELNIRMKIINSNGKDSLLVDSRKDNNNQPVMLQIQQPSFKSDWLNGLTMMTVNDSAVFRVPVDSIRKTMPVEQLSQLPSFLKAGNKLQYEVTMVSIKTMTEYKKEMESKASVQKTTDDKTLQDYFAKNNIKPQKTASGVYYTIEKDGSGALPQTGQTVTINYTGKLLNGTVFDSNTDSSKGHMQPLPVVIGEHRVIPGMEDGLVLLKKGTKATLYIPSPLGYGEHGSGPIAPNSILIFDIDVLDIK